MILSDTFNSIIKVNRNEKVTLKARLFTGRLCNYKCEFCYYKDDLKSRQAFETFEKNLEKVHHYGATSVELSGGESSIEPNWFNFLSKCKEYYPTVSTLSHGGKFSDRVFLQESQDAGLSEILFSVHGSSPEIHDSITGKPGSFDKIVKAIQNSKELGIKVRINCTVYDKNVHALSTEYAQLINALKPSELNFIAMNYGIDNVEFRAIDYNVLSTSIKSAIDSMPDISINVRYIPFCFMQGYESHVLNYYQQVYDYNDWNLALYYPESVDLTKIYTIDEHINDSIESAKSYRKNMFEKDTRCSSCSYRFICDGVDKSIRTTTDIKSVQGTPLLDINHFRKSHVNCIDSDT